MQVINASDSSSSVLKCKGQYVHVNTDGFSTRATSFNTSKAIIMPLRICLNKK